MQELEGRKCPIPNLILQSCIELQMSRHLLMWENLGQTREGYAALCTEQVNLIGCPLRRNNSWLKDDEMLHSNKSPKI